MTTDGALQLVGNDRYTRLLGLQCARQLCLVAPVEYVDLSAHASDGTPNDPRREEHGSRAVYRVRVQTIERQALRRQGAPLTAWRMELATPSGRVTAMVFGEHGRWKQVRPGQTVRVLATVERASPTGLTRLKDVRWIEGLSNAHVLSLYRAPKGVKSAEIAAAIGELIKTQADAICAWLTQLTGLATHVLASALVAPSVQRWLSDLHRPASVQDGQRARAGLTRLAALAAVHEAAQTQPHEFSPRAAMSIPARLVDQIMLRSGVRPTVDQRRAVQQLAKSLRQKMATRAVLSADVGFGKSLVYWSVAVAAAAAGQIVAVIVPRKILVTQAERDAKALAASLPHDEGAVPLEVYAIRNAGQRTVPMPAGGGIYIGTKALVGALRRSAIKPILVVFDEQHVFGAAERETFEAWQNVVEVTATPIPRSIAMVWTGGRELVQLTAGPVQRRVSTDVVDRSGRRALYALVDRAVRLGQRVALVYPRIEVGDPQRERGALAGAAERWRRLFPGRVATLSGRDDDARIEDTLAAYAEMRVQVLATTTLIELGVNLPAVGLMVVIDAHKFGAAQLHQLRGRLGRDGSPARFVLYVSHDLASLTPQSLERLQAVRSTSDGARLAELDLCQRGAGDLRPRGTRQAGTAHSLVPGVRVPAPTLLNAARWRARQPGGHNGLLPPRV